MNVIAIVRTYETLYIVDPNLTDDQLQAIIEKYKNVVTNSGGEVIIADKWDKRRLAYEIKNRREGIYVLMYFKAEPAVASELDRVMRISEDCIRHIIVLDEGGQAETAREKLFKSVPVETAEEEISKEEMEETEDVSVEEEFQEAVESGDIEAETEEALEPAPETEEISAEAETDSEAAGSEGESEAAESNKEE